MKKRIYALALCLLLVMAFPLTAFAEGEDAPAPELTISAQRTDDTLTVTVGIVNNPGVAGCDLALHFNSAALTPSAAPEMAEGWAHCVTNYTEQFSGDTLRVVSVNARNVNGDGVLFTAYFTVTGDGSFALSADGAVCTEEEERIDLSAFTDDFGVKTVSWEGDRLTVTLVSRGGGYHGSGKALLACYDGGRFIGCRIADFTVGENAAADVAFAGAAPSGDTFRLMLTDGSFTPLCAAVDVMPD